MKFAIFCCMASLAVLVQFAAALPVPADGTDEQNGAVPPPDQAAATSVTTVEQTETRSGGGAGPPPIAVSGTLASMSLTSDNGEAVANADGVTMDKLYAGIDLEALVQPYGKPDNTVMDVPPIELPPIEITREGDNRNFLQIYPEIQKDQKIESNKLINTYSVQNKVVNVNNRNTVNYLKTLNVNTDYITNIQRVNHPKLQIQTITHIQNRYIPKLIVKHTRTDRLNDLPPKEVTVPPVEQGSSTELPPVIEKVEIERQDYDANGRSEAIPQAAAAVDVAWALAEAPPLPPQAEAAAPPPAAREAAPAAAEAGQVTLQSAAADSEPNLQASLTKH